MSSAGRFVPVGHGGGSWLGSLHTDCLMGKALGEAERGEGQGDFILLSRHLYLIRKQWQWLSSTNAVH